MNLLKRLEALEMAVGQFPKSTVFRLEGGGAFRVELDPLTYLLKNGVETPRGRIVGIAPSAGELDPIRASLCEEIDRIIKEGNDKGRGS